MEVQVFIFSYAHYPQAKSMFDQFTSLGYDTYLLNCHCPSDPNFEATPKIIKLPNIYYSGQWNEMLTRLTGDVAFITNADVVIPSIPVLMRKLEKYYRRPNAGLYSPNVYWTPWTYNPEQCPHIGDGLRMVPSTDSVIWSVMSEIAHKVGPIDLSLNRLGWGIEVVSAYYCKRDHRTVVRDYSIKCQHPEATAYNRDVADNEFRSWIKHLKLGEQFWDYYHSRGDYGFGWEGDDTIYLPKGKML